MITTTILAIVESFLATLAYAILFNVPKQYYTACGITGMAGWLLYLAMCQVTTVVLASFVGTLAVVLISRILTVRKKCPITIFLVSGIIPLVPGAGIYYTAYYLVTSIGRSNQYDIVSSPVVPLVSTSTLVSCIVPQSLGYIG